MSKPTPVSAIKDILADGAPITFIRGKFTKLYEGHAGETSHGPYRIQNGVWEDEAGDRIDVQIKDMDDDWGKNYLNCPLEIHAFQGDKKLTGLYAFDDTYKQTKRKIKITKTAEVVWLRGDDRQQGRQEERREPPRQQSRRDDTDRRDDRYDDRQRDDRQGQRRDDRREQREPERERRQDPPSDDRKPDPMAEARLEMLRMTHLYCLAYDAATAVAWRNWDQHRQVTVSGGIGALASTLFIEGNKKGLHSKMPITALPPVKGRKVGDLMDILQRLQLQRTDPTHMTPADNSRPAPTTPATQPQEERPPAFKGGSAPGPDDDEIPF